MWYNTNKQLNGCSSSLCHLYHLTLAAICLNNTVIVQLCHCNTSVSILNMYVFSQHRNTQHQSNIQSTSWLKYDINEKISSRRLLLLNVLTICLKQFFYFIIFFSINKQDSCSATVPQCPNNYYSKTNLRICHFPFIVLHRTGTFIQCERGIKLWYRKKISW